jgi:sulfatase maturation enzyme AslB (radical SAM superfamily)
MEFSSFTFVMTDDCNLNCSYCYQKRGKTYLDTGTAKNAVDFFYPFFTQDCFVNFYGGEPLLAFEKIEEIIDYIQRKDNDSKKALQYSITTNGSLLEDDVLQFFNKNKFLVLLSFNDSALSLQKLLKYPDIRLETNSVFTAKTIKNLSRYIKFIIKSGTPTVNLSFSSLRPWSKSALLCLRKELTSLREFCLHHYEKTGAIPVANFRENSTHRVFGCFAGRDRMDLSPDGSLWGCCLFSDYFNKTQKTKEYLKFCFGSLESFVNNHERIYPEILNNYSNLQMDYFYTSKNVCMLCDEMKECVVCPIDAALGGQIIGKIPDWVCQIRKISREEKRNFLRDLKRPTVF